MKKKPPYDVFYLFCPRNFSVYSHTFFGQYKSFVKPHPLKLIMELMSSRCIARGCSLSTVYKDLCWNED